MRSEHRAIRARLLWFDAAWGNRMARRIVTRRLIDYWRAMGAHTV